MLGQYDILNQDFSGVLFPRIELFLKNHKFPELPRHFQKCLGFPQLPERFRKYLISVNYMPATYLNAYVAEN